MDTGYLSKFMAKNIFKRIIWVMLIVAIGGFGGIIADRYVFPYLSTSKIFSKYSFLKKSTEDVTVINKTEQVFIKEDVTVGKVANQTTNSVVNIISLPAPENKITSRKNVTAAIKNGTGTIVTSDGLVVTYVSAINSENSTYKILASDNNVYEAELVGVDNYSNLAFLKINGTNFPAVAMGDSEGATQGERLIAIANGRNLYSNSFSAGILSNFSATYNIAGKAVSFSDKLEGVYEMDADLEPQFIGGPVIDYAGQMVGIIGSVLQNNTEDYFIIPSNKLKKVIDRAISKKITTDASLGIYYIPLTKASAVTNGISTEKGALIYSPSGQQGLAILANSPAQKAGLKINDILTAINGQEINLEKTLPDLLYQFEQGTSIELTVLRDGQEMKIPVQL
jgi:2-alkenal reductase